MDAKRCPSCKKRKSVVSFNRLTKSPDGLGAQCRSCQTSAALMQVHGITLEDYDRQWKLQGYRCAICRRRRARGSHRFAWDHDHATGKARGILCYSCNIKLGWFEKFRASVLRYLERGL